MALEWVEFMKISRLILDLVKYRLKGYKIIDFHIGEYPPNDCCNFIINKHNKIITLRNWIDKSSLNGGDFYG